MVSDPDDVDKWIGAFKSLTAEVVAVVVAVVVRAEETEEVVGVEDAGGEDGLCNDDDERAAEGPLPRNAANVPETEAAVVGADDDVGINAAVVALVIAAVAVVAAAGRRIILEPFVEESDNGVEASSLFLIDEDASLGLLDSANESFVCTSKDDTAAVEEDEET